MRTREKEERRVERASWKSWLVAPGCVNKDDEGNAFLGKQAKKGKKAGNGG